MAECIHMKYNYWGQKRCDLLNEKEDCKKCVFFCDAEKYEYTKREYHGVMCDYIAEKSKPITIPDYFKRG